MYALMCEAELGRRPAVVRLLYLRDRVVDLGCADRPGHARHPPAGPRRLVRHREGVPAGRLPAESVKPVPLLRLPGLLPLLRWRSGSGSLRLGNGGTGDGSGAGESRSGAHGDPQVRQGDACVPRAWRPIEPGRGSRRPGRRISSPVCAATRSRTASSTRPLHSATSACSGSRSGCCACSAADPVTHEPGCGRSSATGIESVVVNAGMKSLFRRRRPRPDRGAPAAVPPAAHVELPERPRHRRVLRRNLARGGEKAKAPYYVVASVVA